MRTIRFATKEQAKAAGDAVIREHSETFRRLAQQEAEEKALCEKHGHQWRRTGLAREGRRIVCAHCGTPKAGLNKR